MTLISKSPVTFRWKQVVQYMISVTVILLRERCPYSLLHQILE